MVRSTKINHQVFYVFFFSSVFNPHGAIFGIFVMIDLFSLR